jgi:cholesterol oxidase
MATAPASPAKSKGTRQKVAKDFLALMRRGNAAEVPFDVVIVGSGYGGSVAASQLAGTYLQEDSKSRRLRRLRVCLLERGREFLPGDFPSTFGQLPRELRVGNQETGTVQGHEGLFDVRLGPDVNVLLANGLGGGSLINAGVMLEPRLQDFADGPWKTLLTELSAGGHFESAKRQLGAEVQRGAQWVPNTIGRLPVTPAKTQALHQLGRDLKAPTASPPITVALDTGPNSAGTEMQACNHCGDCMTGCNVGAKDSLDANLLQTAAAADCEIFTGATVTSFERVRIKTDGQGPSTWVWSLRVAHTDARLQEREEDACVIQAHKVVLAAGTLGSPEILLRSRSDSLALSPRLGEGFSCNGDNIAAVQGLVTATNGCADEDQPLHQRGVGPTITASVQLQAQPSRSHPSTRPFLMQEFSVPGALKRLYEEVTTTAGTLAALPRADKLTHMADDPDPLAVDPLLMSKTLLVGLIGHDEAQGRLRLARPQRRPKRVPQMGGICIDWPNARHGLELNGADDAVRKALAGLVGLGGAGGAASPSWLPNPTWRLLPPELEALVSQPRGAVLTVHPLGGCRLVPDHAPKPNAGPDERAGQGVVDRFGAVFDVEHATKNNTADRWQGSLLVLDGSIIPQSLGVNPALTIAAVALHAMQHWKQAWGLHTQPQAQTQTPHPVLFARPHLGAAQAPAVPSLQQAPQPATTRRTEVEVVERLAGAVSLQGFNGGAVLELTLAYRPVAVQQMIGKDRAAAQTQVDPARSTARLFLAADWQRHNLRVASDAEREPFVCFQAQLHGSLQFLHRGFSTPTQRARRALWVWLRNRGLREVWELASIRWNRWWNTAPQAPGLQSQGQQPSFCQVFVSLWKQATKAGEVRRFDYDLQLGQVTRALNPPLPVFQVDPNLPLDDPKRAIKGHKRLTYERCSSPWTQLTELTLTRFPGLKAKTLPVLCLDTRFLANQGIPLLRISHQRDHAEALAEMVSLGLYLARVVISTHLWTFRKPDAPLAREPERLPGPIAGLPAPEVLDMVVDTWPQTPESASRAGQPLSIRLTRYPRTNSQLPPLVMIHGYSVSGNTFTHPSLASSAAGHFWHQGRDVWVVDLRTSTGLASATYPWAMEQAALVDIPAALLHVHIATGKRVDVLAHCVGCVMLSMALLTDPRSVRTELQELGVDTWLRSGHLAALTALNGPNPQGGAHPVIRSIVLSQKGPVLRYTDDNILRAFVLQFVRRWLLTDNYQFRRSAEPKVGEQVLDRLLSSLPYPRKDYLVDNPLWPCAKAPWTTTRHRMDALYGRDFNAANMSCKTLQAIDDLFGPINLDTVSQTMHFSRFGAATNQRGRGEFVTIKNLKARWAGIPTLAIHGKDNGLVDVHTQQLLQDLLQGSAGVPFKSITFEGMGHQDVLIGSQRRPVFDAIEDFLGNASTLRAAPQALPAHVLEVPWIGPRIEPPQGVPQVLRVACMSRPDQGEATLCLLPAVYTPAAGPVPAAFALWAGVPSLHVAGDKGPSGRWLFATPDLAAVVVSAVAAQAVAAAPQPINPPQHGWLALFLYDTEQTKLAGPGPAWPNPASQASSPATGDGGASASGAQAPTTQPPATRGSGVGGLPATNFGHTRLALVDEQHADGSRFNLNSFAALGTFALTQRSAPAVASGPSFEELAQWVQQKTADELSNCFVRLDDLQRAQNQAFAAEPTAPRRFVLASCQYPTGLLDSTPANASLHAMAGWADRADLAVLVGDQIYADATAGLLDPVRSDEVYDLPHERALREPGMRKLLRRLPTHMLLDDHEIADNWEPLPKDVAAGAEAARAARLAAARELGLAAYLRYQRMAPNPSPRRRGEPVQNRKPLPAADFSFYGAGHPFYMLDTRTGRARNAPSGDPWGWQIVTRAQQDNLAAWLLEHQHEVKFVATPSMLLPRHRDVSANLAARSDGWSGFPATVRWLLRFLVDRQITRTVFVSGDEHHSLVAQAWLGPDRLKIVSVHSSALYAPFPFANGQPQKLQLNDVVTDCGVAYEVSTQLAPPGDGFALLEVVDGTAAAPRLRVRFEKSTALPAVPFDVGLV